MMDLSQWFANADAIDAAILAVGIDPALACAVVEMESGGRHVYGNDSGGVFSTPGAPEPSLSPSLSPSLRTVSPTLSRWLSH